MNRTTGLDMAVAMMRRWEPRPETDALFDGIPYHVEMELRFRANMDWTWLVCDGMLEMEAEVLCAEALGRAAEAVRMALGIEEGGVGGGSEVEMDGIGLGDSFMRGQMGGQMDARIYNRNGHQMGSPLRGVGGMDRPMGGEREDGWMSGMSDRISGAYIMWDLSPLSLELRDQ